MGKHFKHHLYITKYTNDKDVCSLVSDTRYIRSTYNLVVFSHPCCTSTTLVDLTL